MILSIFISIALSSEGTNLDQRLRISGALPLADYENEQCIISFENFQDNEVIYQYQSYGHTRNFQQASFIRLVNAQGNPWTQTFPCPMTRENVPYNRVRKYRIMRHPENFRPEINTRPEPDPERVYREQGEAGLRRFQEQATRAAEQRQEFLQQQHQEHLRQQQRQEHLRQQEQQRFQRELDSRREKSDGPRYPFIIASVSFAILLICCAIRKCCKQEELVKVPVVPASKAEPDGSEPLPTPAMVPESSINDMFVEPAFRQRKTYSREF